MAKSKTNAGNTNAGNNVKSSLGKKIGAAKRATMTKTAKRTTATKKSPQRQGTARRASTTGKSSSKQGGRQEAGPARLRPITQRQSRDQIIATVATDSGVERPIVERVARGLAQTLTRHLMRNGSGRVDIPYLGAALWRGREGARPAREMASPLLDGRIVIIPARPAMSVARLKPHETLKKIVARA